MRKLVIVFAVLLASAGITVPTTANAAYNFGDFRSETLATKAWKALKEGDLEGVLAYTNKCIELYAGEARKMQNSLTDYAQGENSDIFKYWALNDVATSYFIQGEAYRQAGKNDDAVAAYQKVVDDFSFGQTWDTKGWFWKPAKAAAEKIAMIKSGSTLDFGDYSSSFLTQQAWKANSADDTKAVIAYVDKVLELYTDEAKAMQSSMTGYGFESEDIFSKWALNDVGTAYFIKAEALKKAGETKEAKEAYKELVDNYYYAQCWDPNGWFWKPAEAAQQSLDELSGN